MENLAQTILKIMVIAPPVIFAIIVHEVAHGWVANKLGDPTARNMGRLTLNPVRHIDLFGTIIMPLLLYAMTYDSPSGPTVFGYAKPVPINPYNFKDPKKGMALSSLAGPGVNMIMAMSFAFVLRFVMPALEGPIPKPAWDWFAVPVALMLGYGVIVNVVLAVLNMIPVPPLDGSRIVYWLLPDRQAAAYYRLERFGMLILLALLGTGIIARVITPIIRPILFFLLGENIF